MGTNNDTNAPNNNHCNRYERPIFDKYSRHPILHDAKWFGMAADEWLRYVLAIHFDPAGGSQYWLQREKALGIDARKDVTSLEDLHLLGPMGEEDLRRYPLECFIPKSYLKNREGLILGETAGTTGLPKVTAYTRDEFLIAFVEWFVYVAVYREFPQGANWLWVGPGGPHIIGKAVGPVAKRMGSMDPFSIDVDPRWAKKLPPDSLGYKRYLNHLVEQALSILERQNIGVIYSTPPLLERLAGEMNAEHRMRIRGIHYGGVAIGREQLKRFRGEYFSNAVHIAGYGNTLFGLCMEIEESADGDLDYYPPGPRMVVQVVSTKDGILPDKRRLSKIVEYGEKGQVVCHRIDESFLIPNMFERDEAVRIAPSGIAQSLGVYQDGVRNPSLLKGLEANAKVGVY